MKDERENNEPDKLPLEVPLQTSEEVPVITQIKAPLIEPKSNAKSKMKSAKNKK